jgi:transcriptional regulator with XRE-family HTH domain
VTEFDLPGALRRIRRAVDCSQRELADRLDLSKSSIAAAETGARDVTVRVLTTAVALAGWRLAVLDDAGEEVASMASGAVRDRANRRFPAHLDVRYGDEDWWHGRERYARDQPWYTFDRLRWTRDHWRSRTGTPEDHQLPGPGDSPEEREAARRHAARLRREDQHRRRRESDAGRPVPDFECTCPPACDEVDDWSGRPVHAEKCPCSCDLS